MNKEQIETYKQACELATSIYISSLVAEFKKQTGKEICSISIPMIDVTDLGSAFDSKFIPGQCRIKLVEEQKACNCSLRTKLAGDGCEVCNPDYAKQFEQKDTWKCCGGVDLQEDEKCPVCGDKYD